jgi:hypothetical protein
LVVVAALAACDGQGGTNADRLTPAEVAGVYQLCALRFTPTQPALPAADLLQRVIDPAPPVGKLPPTLTLSPIAPRFELAYTRRGDGFTQIVRGDVEFGDGSVFLYLLSDAPAAAQQEALLPPSHLDLVFTAEPRRLTAGTEVGAYWVRRSDYTHAAGISEEGLQDRIWGHVTATFAGGTCP